MENKTFFQAVAGIFTMMILSLISLLMMTSCTDSLTTPDHGALNDAGAPPDALCLRVAYGDMTNPDYENLDVFLHEGRIERTITKKDLSVDEMTIFNYESPDTIIVICGDNSQGVMNAVSYESVIQLGKDSLPSAFTTSNCREHGITVSGGLEYSFYPSGETRKIHILRGDYQSIGNNTHEAIIEFSYEEDTDGAIPSNLRWARFHPEIINGLTLCQGLGDIIATYIYNSGCTLNKIKVTYAMEDPFFPGKIIIEYNGMKVRSMHQSPGSYVMGYSNSDLSLSSYYSLQ